MAAVVASKPIEPSLGAFAPAEGSLPMQTPFGSIQLANATAQQSLNFLGMAGGAGGESDEEEDDDDDDDDEGGAKKRKRSKAGASNKKTAAGKVASNGVLGTTTTSGERDMHTGRRKIRIEFIEDDSRRHITFSKRKAGIMKKAYELATLTGTQVLLLIVSQTGLVYTFTTPKLSPVVQEAEGRELIQSCLNAPEPNDQQLQPDHDGSNDSNEGENTTEDSDQGLGPQHYANDLSHHHQQQQQQQQHHSIHAANNDMFHDPRNGMVMPHHINDLNINVPHLSGIAYGGYPGHHMNMHDQAISYGSYGL